VQVEHPGEDGIAFVLGGGHALAGQGGSVERGRFGQQFAVQGQFFAGAEADGLADADGFRTDGRGQAVAQDGGLIGTLVQQGADVGLRPPDGLGLEQFAHGIEQHHGHALRVFADGERAGRGDAHQQKLGEKRALSDAFQGLPQHGHPDRNVGEQIPNKAHPAGKPVLRKPIVQRDAEQK